MTKAVRGVVFDMDGTLCLPQKHMFREMREALGISKSEDILDHVHGLPEGAQPAAHAKLEAIERRAMLEMEAQPGLGELVAWIKAKELPMAICTRNFPIPVGHLLSTFLAGYTFDPVITREFRPPKPAPDGILRIAAAWGLDASELVMVGDSIDDMRAGRSAGAQTVLLRNSDNGELAGVPETDYVVDSLLEVIGVLRAHERTSGERTSGASA